MCLKCNNLMEMGLKYYFGRAKNGLFKIFGRFI